MFTINYLFISGVEIFFIMFILIIVFGADKQGIDTSFIKDLKKILRVLRITLVQVLVQTFNKKSIKSNRM